MTATDQNPQQSAQPTPHKTINVVGAAIVKDGKVLCAQRGEGRSLAGFWEFPGGKIEPHETARHEIRWVAPAEMPTLDWAPADREAVRLISAMDFPAFPAATHESDD